MNLHEEEIDVREIRYFGQEAMIALQNKAIIRVCEELSQEAMDQLIEADPNDTKAVAICQLRIKAVAEIGERLEIMAKRGLAMAQEEETGPPAKDLN